MGRQTGVQFMKRDILWAATVIFVFVMGGGVGHSGGQEEPASPLLDERFCADASGDGKLDITDAVTILQYLFQGTTTPYCIAEGSALADFATRAELESLRTEIENLQQDSARSLRPHWGTYTGDGTNDRVISTGIEGEIVSLQIAWRCARVVPGSCTLREHYKDESRITLGMAPGTGMETSAVFLDGPDFVINHSRPHPETGENSSGRNEAAFEYVWFALVRDSTEAAEEN